MIDLEQDLSRLFNVKSDGAAGVLIYDSLLVLKVTCTITLIYYESHGLKSECP